MSRRQFERCQDCKEVLKAVEDLLATYSAKTVMDPAFPNALARMIGNLEAAFTAHKNSIVGGGF